MKVAIFSDIHGNYQALECILDDIKNEEYDEIIYLGDAIAIGPDSKKCLELLKQSNVKYILGNHELYFLIGTKICDNMTATAMEHQKWVTSQLDNSDKEFLENCPLEYTLEKYGRRIKFSHFILNDNKERYPFDKEYPFIKTFELQDKDTWFKYSKDYDYYFVGHVHEGYTYSDIIKDDDVSNLILVGSSGCTKEDQTSYIGLEINQKTTSFIKYYRKYDRKEFIKAIERKDYYAKDFVSKSFFGIDCK